MAIIRAQVSFPAASADSEDTVVNNWHFDVTDPETEGNLTPVATALDTFYTSLISYFATSNVWSNGRIKMYDYDDPPPRAPLYDQPFVVTGSGSGTWLPRECAICLSFQGDQISGIRQARRRGRVYLGPLGSATNNTTTGMVVTAVTTAIAAAATTLMTADVAASGWAWIVYSPTMGEGAPVTNGWVDNAWDIQRRRGVDADVRTTFGS